MSFPFWFEKFTPLEPFNKIKEFNLDLDDFPVEDLLRKVFTLSIEVDLPIQKYAFLSNNFPPNDDFYMLFNGDYRVLKTGDAEWVWSIDFFDSYELIRIEDYCIEYPESFFSFSLEELFPEQVMSCIWKLSLDNNCLPLDYISPMLKKANEMDYSFKDMIESLVIEKDFYKLLMNPAVSTPEDIYKLQNPTKTSKKRLLNKV